MSPAAISDSKWTTVSRRLVKPDVGRDPECMELTPLDFLFTDLFSSYLFLYKRGSEGAEIGALDVDGLIRSLSKTLVHFYPLAGRLIKNPEDGSVRLHCNDAGAVWIHKRYDGLLSDVLDESNFQPDERFSGLADTIPRDQEVYDPSGRPALIVQVAEFQCGTTVLSPSWSHMVADGFSALHFLKSWAEISRGESISLVPNHNRSLLAVKKACKPAEDCSSLRSLNLTPQTACRKLAYSKRRIEELKAEARGDGDGGARLSTASCFLGHLWRETLRAHDDLEPSRRSQVIILVDCRSRIQDFPAGFFGNCLAMASVGANVGDLLSKPLQFAASAVHEAMRTVDEDTIGQLIASLFRDPLCLLAEPFDTTHTLSCSWMMRFPFYELDFGSGIPTNILRNIPSRTIVEMFYVFPRSPASSGPGDLVLVAEGDGRILSKFGDDQ